MICRIYINDIWLEILIKEGLKLIVKEDIESGKWSQYILQIKYFLNWIKKPNVAKFVYTNN
jgi:hypothetical protein